MRVRRVVTAACFVVSTSACAGRHRPPDETAIVIPPTVVVLEVENHNWADIVLYVVHDGVRTRFLQIPAAHNLSVEIPANLQGQMGVIQIAARRIGGTDSFVSQTISLRGNSAVRFTIESSLSRSSVGVW